MTLSERCFALGDLNYRENIHPQLAFGDATGYTFDAMFDPEGNLYLGDWNWNRVLVYKTPFEKFVPAGGTEESDKGH